MNNPLRIKRQTTDKGTRVIFEGEITEHANFAEVGALQDRAIFDLGGITRINSTGVREWIQFVNHMPGNLEVTYERCASAIILQTNMISNFLRGGKIVSFAAPYYCEKCSQASEVLLDVNKDLPDRKPTAPPRRCGQCGGSLVFDDVEENYLAFLKHQ